LFGGNGNGAIANVGVTTNLVTDIGVAAGGSGYKAGDILVASAGGSGFSVKVDAVEEEASYGALPAGHTIEGVTVSTVTTDEASVSIMTLGSVNKVASRYPVTPEIEAALPRIRFTQD
jgi:hypothetical protein